LVKENLYHKRCNRSNAPAGIAWQIARFGLQAVLSHRRISGMVIFLPVIKIPTLKTLETAQNATSTEMIITRIDAAICIAGGGMTTILIIMTLGAKNGIIDKVTARGLDGIRTMAMATMTGSTSRSTSGVCVCWTSVSVVQTAPTPAKSEA